MKTLCCVILIFALLAASGRLPFAGHETQELNPIQTLVADFDGDQVEITADSGQSGVGDTWDEAVADLKNSSVGKAFLETAEKLVVCGATLKDLASVAASNVLRPAAEVFAGIELEDVEQVADYLKTKLSNVTVAKIKTALAEGETVPNLPELEEKDEKVELTDGEH